MWLQLKSHDTVGVTSDVSDFYNGLDIIVFKMLLFYVLCAVYLENVYLFQLIHNLIKCPKLPSRRRHTRLRDLGKTFW